MAISDSAQSCSLDTSAHAISQRVLDAVATHEGVAADTLNDTLTQHRETVLTADFVWETRFGTTTDSILYDSNDYIIIECTAPNADSLTALSAAARRCHAEAAAHIADDREVGLTPEGTYLVVEPTTAMEWGDRVAAECDRPYAPVEYEVNFACPKWDDYDVSVCAWAEIAGRHGTLRKDVRVQGFPTHRSTETDTVRLHTTLSHLETDHEFESGTETYEVPDARSFDAYPQLPQVRQSVYNVLFTDASEYDALVTGEFDLCERCGTFERPEEHLLVTRAIDPDGGWEREYCTECYARRLHDEYGVTLPVGRIYALRSAGIAYTTIAEWVDRDVAFVREMADGIDEAVQAGERY